MLDLKPLIFVLCRLTALFLLYRGQPRKPSSETKMPFRGRVAHPISARGFWKVFVPNTHPEGVQTTSCFPAHFWMAQKGREYALKRRNFVQRTSSPVSWTGTYSIRSPGWHSKRPQRVSRFSQDTPCLFLNFWSVDWLNNPSVRILLVL